MKLEKEDNCRFIAQQYKGRSDVRLLPHEVSSYLEAGLIDEVIRVIKSGKESIIYLTARKENNGKTLFALKVHKPRAYRSFKRDRIYKTGMFDEKRRASLGSSWAKKAADEYWVTREFTILKQAKGLGVSAPTPIKTIGNTILMTYLGDERQPAPKLIEVPLNGEEILSAFNQVKNNVRLLYEGGIVHADLSPYNMLWFQNKIYLIDFPQAVGVHDSPYSLDLLYRDLGIVCRYFRKIGIECNSIKMFKDLTSFKYYPGRSFEDYLEESDFGQDSFLS